MSTMAEIYKNSLHDGLDRLAQTSTIESFYNQFAAIRDLVSSSQPWLPEVYFTDRFIYGLHHDVQPYVIKFKPVTVLDAYHLACIYEYSLYLQYFPESRKKNDDIPLMNNVEETPQAVTSPDRGYELGVVEDFSSDTSSTSLNDNSVVSLAVERVQKLDDIVSDLAPCWYEPVAECSVDPVDEISEEIPSSDSSNRGQSEGIIIVDQLNTSANIHKEMTAVKYDKDDTNQVSNDLERNWVVAWACSQNSDLSMCSNVYIISLLIEDYESGDSGGCNEVNPHNVTAVVRHIISIQGTNVFKSSDFMEKIDVPIAWRLHSTKGIVVSLPNNRTTGLLVNGGSANAGAAEFLSQFCYGLTKQAEPTLQLVVDYHVVVLPWRFCGKVLVPAMSLTYKFRQLYVLIYAQWLFSTKTFNNNVRNKELNIVRESIHVFDTVVQLAGLSNLSENDIMKRAKICVLYFQPSHAKVFDSYGALGGYYANIVAVMMQSRLEVDISKRSWNHFHAYPDCLHLSLVVALQGPSSIFSLSWYEFGCYFLTIQHSTFNWKPGPFFIHA